MLRKLLTPEQCAKCKYCCGFVESDRWEIPLFAGEKERRTAESFAPVKQLPNTKSCVFSMEFDGDRLIMCPAASEHGCLLGENRPFDCRVWPFRVMSLGKIRVITLSTVCPAAHDMKTGEVAAFVNADGFAQMMFRHAREFPETVKPYIEGYPIFAADSTE